MADLLTILKHPTSLLAKTWQADGSVKAYDDAKFFVCKEIEVDGIEALSGVLSQLEHDARACVIRGKYVGHDKAAERDPEFKHGKVRRIADLYDDVPHHWLLAEIDNFEPLCADPVLQPVMAIEEFIATHLPACFQGVAYHWQLSNSAGHAKNVGKLKAHVWFWLAKPYTSDELKAWAGVAAADLDRSVFNVVQVHYTAAPVFEEGVVDPVPVRSGFVSGLVGDDVELEIDAAMLANAQAGAKPSRHARLLEVADNDPVAQRLADLELVKSVGKKGELFIECPLSENHTQESGPTATAYYPAHTGGYANGAFVCQHAHCRDVAQSVFLAKIGVDPVEDDFEVVGEKAAEGSKVRIPEALHLTTDQANAVRIVKRYGKRLMVSADRWYAWVGTHWAQDDAAVYRFALNLSKIIRGEADQWRAKKGNTPQEWEKNVKIADAMETWAKKSEMKNTIEAALGLARRMLAVKAEDLDADHWALNCANGTVDLRTGKLREHNPEDYITRLIPLQYLPNVRAPLFERVVEQVTCEEGAEDKPLAKFLQRWFGYCATGSVREQKFAVHYGQGRNGKSTILDTIAEVLGSYAATAAPGLLARSSGRTADRHPAEIADLFGRRMVTAHESGEGQVLREDFVKQATGGDRLKARHMHANFFEFDPTHKLQLLTNYKPRIKGQDEGIWRRVMLVPFKAKFGTAEEVAKGAATHLRDNRIAEHLIAEKTGVLTWIVAGAIEWFREGLNPPDVVLAASKDYQTEQDRVLQFIHEECETGPDLVEKLNTRFGGGLYPTYANWCKTNGYQPLAKNNMLAELERCVPFFAQRNVDDRRKDAERCKYVEIRGLKLIETEL